MPYLIYLRKSRADIEAEEHGEMETLARHEKLLMETAKRLQLQIGDIYREVMSGDTIAARPMMQRLLSEVGQGMWEGVLVTEIERLARGDTIDQGMVAQAFKYSNTKIITPAKIYDPNNEFDEEYFEFNLYMSRREYKTINRRQQRGRIASFNEGKYVYGNAPYGFKSVKLEHEKGHILEPIPDQADVIRMIFDWYINGMVSDSGIKHRIGSALITQKLNMLGIKNRDGLPWKNSNIIGILRNPVYAGKLRRNHKPSVKRIVDGKVKVSHFKRDDYILVDGRHHAIIDYQTWLRAQEIMSTIPPGPIGFHGDIKNPLSGLIKCGICGRNMTRHPYQMKDGRRDQLKCIGAGCTNVCAMLNLVEKRVLEGLAQWLEDYRLHPESTPAAHQRPQITLLSNGIKKLDEYLAEFYKQSENIHGLLERGLYDENKFLERTHIIEEKIRETKEQRAILNTEMNMEMQREEQRISFIPKVEHLLSVYNELASAQAKNDMLKEVIEKIVYIRHNGGRWHIPQDDFELTIYPKVPQTSWTQYST